MWGEMAILITGGSGFVGSALTEHLLTAGHRVYSLSRHPPEATDRLIPLAGDITEPNLGLIEMKPLKNITRVYHLAGIHTLRQEDKDGSIWRTNVEGTRNVLEFCLKHDVPRFYFTSTAYAWPVNPYGFSKMRNEADISSFSRKHGIKTTIFKPSIVVATPEHPYPGHFSKFILAVIAATRGHKRAEFVRRKIEGTLRLPVLEPVFRIKGNPEGKLNLISIDAVSHALATISKEGTFWLTNPNPPTLAQLGEGVGEIIMLRLKFEPEFKPTPIEAAFQKMTTAFEPYLQGHDFKSDLKRCPPITREFIHQTVRGIVS